jgi:hypothetical protein
MLEANRAEDVICESVFYLDIAPMHVDSQLQLVTDA